VLQCVAVCCSVLQCVAVCCSVCVCLEDTQCVAVCYRVLQCVAACLCVCSIHWQRITQACVCVSAEYIHCAYCIDIPPCIVCKHTHILCVVYTYTPPFCDYTCIQGVEDP